MCVGFFFNYMAFLAFQNYHVVSVNGVFKHNTLLGVKNARFKKNFKLK